METKVGMGTAALGLHPKVAREKIREATTEALGDLERFKLFQLDPPYQMVLKVRREKPLFPGAEKTRRG